MSDLRAALEPFAKLAEVVEFNARMMAPDERVFHEERGDRIARITYGDLRRARSALAGDGETVRALQAYEEALKPSALTKAAYIGEFSFTIPLHDEDGNEHPHRVIVPWDTTKEIMKMIREYALSALPSPMPSHTLTSICGDRQLDVTEGDGVTSSPTAEPVQKMHELPGPEADALLCKIALLRIWQDTYPDGPDLVGQRYEILPSDVRTARAYVAARDASPVRLSWLPPPPMPVRGEIPGESEPARVEREGEWPLGPEWDDGSPDYNP